MKMWANLRNSKLNGGVKELKRCPKSLNVNEEYLHAFRTKSYADFVTKAQPLVNNDELSSPTYFYHTFSESLLEPGQETVSTILESALHDTNNNNASFSRNSSSSDFKDILSHYFEISAEASKLCTNLLKGTNKIQSHYKFIQQILQNTLDDDYHSSEQLTFITLELRSFLNLNNPFSNINKQDFKIIHEKYSSVLQILKLKKKRVAKKIKMIKCFNKASGICVTAVCGLVAITALAIASFATHTLTALILGPALFTLPMKPLKKKLLNFQFLRSGFLRKIREQLDVAEKGTYIIDRDFDTMSTLVTRLHDEIEHNKAMIMFCLDRKDDKLSLQVLKEIKKGDYVFTKQVEELQEHLYLCLVTINRARALVVKELAKTGGTTSHKYNCNHVGKN